MADVTMRPAEVKKLVGIVWEQMLDSQLHFYYLLSYQVWRDQKPEKN